MSNIEIKIYWALFILVGLILAGLEYVGLVEHKLTFGDFVVEVLLFVLTVLLAGLVKLYIQREEQSTADGKKR